MQETLDGCCLHARLKKSMGTQNITLGKSKAITERIVHVRLSRKVQHRVDVLTCKNDPQ